MADHKPGCEALGGYGHGAGPCGCGAGAQTPVLTDEQITRAADAADCRWLLKEYSLSLSAFARAVLAAQAPAQPAEVRIRTSQPARAVMQQALEAIDVEFSDEWECNAYHPKLHAARAALFAALSATMEKPNG